ncbi:MAG: WD40 repeat domain-containing protein [Promethearchaeota archaeon]
MSKKNLLLLIIIVSGFLLPLSYFNTAKSTPPLYINDEIDNRVSFVCAPESSAAKVTSLWNYTGTTAIDQVVISKDGSHIAAINSTHAILFNKSSNVPLWNYTLPFSENPPTSIDISYNGTYIAVQGLSRTFLLNNSQDSPKTYMWYLEPPALPSRAVAISETGTYIVAAHQQTIYFINNSFSTESAWNILPEWDYFFPGPAFPDPYAVAISYNGDYIVAGCDDGFVYFFNKTKTNPKTYEWRFNTTAQIGQVDSNLIDIGYDYINDLYYIVVANNEKEVYLLDSTIENPKTAVWNATLDNIARTIDISSDGTNIVASTGNYIYYFDNSPSPTLKEELWKRYYGSVELSTAISADGKYVVAGIGGPTTMYLINHKNETLWSTPQPVSSVGISGLGDYIVGGRSNKIYLYYHDIPKPIILGGGGGDNDDEEEEEAAIPFGNYYLVFACVTLISLIVLMKRKVIFKV